ncbi:MAG: hypothetical protein ACOC5T_09920 [Elusimicrobiota bacterium]
MNNLQKILLVICLVVSSGLCYAGEPSLSPGSQHMPRKRFGKNDLFKKSDKLISVSPSRPLVIRDKNGNVTFTTSKGKAIVRIDKEGNRTFFISGRKNHKRDKKGGLTRQYKRKGGSNKVEVQNEFNEKIGVEEYGFGGKLIAEYDENDNLTKTNKYGKYGKTMQWIVDELTLTKTVCDDKGKPIYDVNFEGYKVARYVYDKKTGKLKYKEDAYKNRTYFKKNGNMDRTEDVDGNILTTYNYKKDENGYYSLDTVKDERTGRITIYKESKPDEIRNEDGIKIGNYRWEGSKLICLENIYPEGYEIEWYKNGRPTYTTFKGNLISERVYYKGKLAGTWDERNNKFELYTHGRKEIKVHMEIRPTIHEILELYKVNNLQI